jgi:predicted nuclease with TOPRIM domain
MTAQTANLTETKKNNNTDKKEIAMNGTELLVNQINKEKEALEKEVAKKEKKFDDLNNKLHKIEEEREKIREEIKPLNQEVKEMRKKIANFDAAIASLTGTLVPSGERGKRGPSGDTEKILDKLGDTFNRDEFKAAYEEVTGRAIEPGAISSRIHYMVNKSHLLEFVGTGKYRKVEQKEEEATA